MDLNQTIITPTADETKALGHELATYLVNSQRTTHNSQPFILCLYGELGSGKTTFLQGFAQGLGLQDRLLSPTFVLMRSYEVNELVQFHHLDLYRLETMGELKSISFSELITNPNNMIAIEWSERLGDNLPKNRIDIHFKVIDQGHMINISSVVNGSVVTKQLNN